MIDAATKAALERLEKREASGAITSTLIASETKDPFVHDLLLVWRELRRLRAAMSFEGVVEPTVEDRGMAQIADIGNEEGDGMFVRLQSWSDSSHHPDMARLRGHRVRVIIDPID